MMTRSVLLFVLIAAGLAQATAKSAHDNMIYFDGVDSLTWTPNTDKSYSITDGQPYEGTSAEGSAIDVVAGRHKSAPPAADFNAGIQVVNMIATEISGPITVDPNDLNFAVFGTITFTIGGKEYECKDMRLGQGSYGSTNNWWLGSTKCISATTKGHTLNCRKILGFGCGLSFHSEGNSDHFQVSVIEEDKAEVDALMI
eukprot:gnl/MRDRNA2_/MRDRNA2_90544_c0_seq1.p1 gnl/MRDRNA2_/MRDRNA2_90544_c0~~gnl/MRDRNA2_/MRDRNA2_90544_c0_seq1.p1  ORF type:complete len:199 (+),score=29.80 gnl/MRDRNA2_/MRDRNA2_90544_c0_seq1:82-678(+)